MEQRDDRARLLPTPDDISGMERIADWLKETIEREGADRPTFRVIAQYIESDIRDALDDAKTELREKGGVFRRYNELGFVQPFEEVILPKGSEVRYSEADLSPVAIQLPVRHGKLGRSVGSRSEDETL